MDIKKIASKIPVMKTALAASFGLLAYNMDPAEYHENFLNEAPPEISYSTFRDKVDSNKIDQIFINKNTFEAVIIVNQGETPFAYSINLPDNFDADIVRLHAPQADINFVEGGITKKQLTLFLHFLALSYSGAATGSWIKEGVEGLRERRKNKSKEPDQDYIKKTAYHEAAHAVVGTVLKGFGPLDYVTGKAEKGSLGHAQFNDDDKNATRSQYVAEIAIDVAACAIEQNVYKEHDSGISGDLSNATSTAHYMVTKLGFGKRTGLRAWDEDITIHKGYKLRHILATVSGERIADATLRDIDLDIKDILDEAMTLARKTLDENEIAVEVVAEELMKNDKLTGSEVKEIVENHKNATPASDNILEIG